MVCGCHGNGGHSAPSLCLGAEDTAAGHGQEPQETMSPPTRSQPGVGLRPLRGCPEPTSAWKETGGCGGEAWGRDLTASGAVSEWLCRPVRPLLCRASYRVGVMIVQLRLLLALR